MNKKNNKKSLQNALPVIIPLTVCVLLVGVALGSTDVVTSEQISVNQAIDNTAAVKSDSI